MKSGQKQTDRSRLRELRRASPASVVPIVGPQQRFHGARFRIRVERLRTAGQPGTLGDVLSQAKGGLDQPGAVALPCRPDGRKDFVERRQPMTGLRGGGGAAAERLAVGGGGNAR